MIYDVVTQAAYIECENLNTTEFQMLVAAMVSWWLKHVPNKAKERGCLSIIYLWSVFLLHLNAKQVCNMMGVHEFVLHDEQTLSQQLTMALYTFKDAFITSVRINCLTSILLLFFCFLLVTDVYRLHFSGLSVIPDLHSPCLCAFFFSFIPY